MGLMGTMKWGNWLRTVPVRCSSVQRFFTSEMIILHAAPCDRWKRRVYREERTNISARKQHLMHTGAAYRYGGLQVNRK